MSRSGYTDDGEGIEELWRRTVINALRGKRGQRALRELLAALDAMPTKALIAEEFEYEGQFCTLGTLCHAKGIDMSEIDPEDQEHAENVAVKLNIAPCMVQEIEYMNDEWGPYTETPEQRWERMRAWVASQINDLA